jgi:trans-aconitate 2-methyltransferase
MQRICEPELMDDSAQAAAYANADFSAGDQALLERFVDLFGADQVGDLVDLGCGPGNITFLLAERFGAARVLGVDGSEAMLQIASRRLAAEPGRWPGLRFAQELLSPTGLLPSLGGRFSAVISNSLLHHLHDPQGLWTAVRWLGAPGAAVYIKDLRRPASPEAVLALRDRYLPEAPPVLQHDYVASLHAAFTTAEVRQQLADAGLAEHLQVAELEDRYLEVWGCLAG